MYTKLPITFWHFRLDLSLTLAKYLTKARIKKISRDLQNLRIYSIKNDEYKKREIF